MSATNGTQGGSATPTAPELASQLPADIIAKLFNDSAREAALDGPEVAVGLGMAYVVEKVRGWGTILGYAHYCRRMTNRGVRPVDIDALLDRWLAVIVDLAIAHDHEARSRADEQTDDLLRPLLTAPIAQVREFAVRLGQRLQDDQRVPFLVWSAFRKVVEPVVKASPEGPKAKLHEVLAGEVAALVGESLERSEMVASIAAALQWRSAESLRKVKASLEKGAKPRLRGGQSCLFLTTVDSDGKEEAKIVL